MTRAAATSSAFDESHYASSRAQILLRSATLGPRYFLWDLPRYLIQRRALGLPVWDSEAVTNGLKEFDRKSYVDFELPPDLEQVIRRLQEQGIRFALPKVRLEAVVGAWWSTRSIRGDVIECGAYLGSTSLLLASLGKAHGIPQRCLILDTFSGTPFALILRQYPSIR